jgi:redox-regulated HSP33 family molecular chaperone
LAQSSQQAHSQLQLGQSLQHSSEQHAAFALLLQQLATSLSELEEVPAKAAAIRPEATARPPNSLTNMVQSLFRNELKDDGALKLNRPSTSSGQGKRQQEWAVAPYRN